MSFTNADLRDRTENFLAKIIKAAWDECKRTYETQNNTRETQIMRDFFKMRSLEAQGYIPDSLTWSGIELDVWWENPNDRLWNSKETVAFIRFDYTLSQVNAMKRNEPNSRNFYQLKYTIDFPIASKIGLPSGSTVYDSGIFTDDDKLKASLLENVKLFLNTNMEKIINYIKRPRTGLFGSEIMDNNTDLQHINERIDRLLALADKLQQR